ncbi:hypothetical protein HUK47_11755 [Lactobacillus crispatus]|nr:hypothetical protein [Lactobacillus crispatus]
MTQVGLQFENLYKIPHIFAQQN